ncbi:MAG: hypothetical protein HGA63_11135, partial [Syntrophobacteraceae bacterium]|nr:hypothetical protein [Syntrophobacteraceae bacterium]
MRNADLAAFNMPVLKNDYSIGRSADHIEREAYEKAFTAGEKAGFEMGEQKAQVLIEKVEALINELVTLKKTIVKEVEPWRPV